MQFDNHKLESLIELSAVLIQQNEYQEILRLVAEKASVHLEAEAVMIMMINPRTRQSVKTIFKDVKETEESRYHTVQTHVGGWIITTISHL